MPSPINNELEDNYNKRKIVLPLSIFLLLVIPMVITLLFPLSNLSLAAVLSSFVAGFILINYLPYLSEYDYMRYHLKKLIEFSDGGYIKKSNKHINKLAYHISEFNSKLEDIFLLRATKQTLDDFLVLLRSQNHPNLTESDLKSYSNILRDIDFAMDAKDTKLLNDTLVPLIEKKESQQSHYLFSYETPSISERFTKETIHLIKNNKSVKFTVKSILIFFVLVGLAYFLSPKLSFLDFDSSTIEVSLLAALAFASQI